MLNIDDLFISLSVLICFRLAAFIVFFSRYIRDNRSRYGAISLGWLTYAVGPVFGLLEYVKTGSHNHPIFGYSAAVGTFLLMFGILLYHFKLTLQWFVTLFLFFVIGFGMLLSFYPEMGGTFGVTAQLLLIVSTLIIVVFKRKWLISISGNASYIWLSLFLLLSLLHAFGFNFWYSEIPISLRFVMTFLTNLFLYIFLLDFDWGQSLRKQRVSEAKLNSSLIEKETLLQEIHHRVKNNMQVISSLLKLQSNVIKDQNTKKVLIESQNRVKAMATVHENLYKSKNLSSLNILPFLNELASSILKSYQGISKNITFEIDSEELFISIDQASPLGLIVNELFSNSLKYAFSDERQGNIWIKLKRLNDEEIYLRFSDNGIGIPESFEWQNLDSLGLKLVKNLVENQLDGSIKMKIDDGTTFDITFKEDQKLKG